MENNSSVERQLRKQTGLLRAQVFLRVVILLIVVAAGFFLVKELRTLGNVLTLAEEKLEALDVEKLNAAVKSVSEAAENLKDIDAETIDGVSSAIRSAADGIRGLDLDRIDALVKGLDSAAGKLDSAVNSFKSIFK